jgi:hypothetical protein
MFIRFFWFSEQPWISAVHLFIKIQKFINNQQMHLIVYDVFYSQYSHQRVSAGMPAISRLLFLLQE